MNAPLKPFRVRLVTRGFLEGTVEASSTEDAEERTFDIWRTECPHPFVRSDDDELVSVEVEAEEVQPVRSGKSDARLTNIVKRILGIPTLETRNADSLDFHAVSVWQVTEALQVAFNTGEGARSKLVTVIGDLLGDKQDICSGRCIRCGRDYSAEAAVPQPHCLSDDCPSFKARALLQRLKAGVR